MNKLVLQAGLLAFTLSIIFFSRIKLPFEEVLFRAFLVFIATTFLLGIIMLVFIKVINNASYNKYKEVSEKISREKLDE